jgi:hypothetical protein
MWGRGSSGTKLQPSLNNRRSALWRMSILPTLVTIRKLPRRDRGRFGYFARGNFGVRLNLMKEILLSRKFSCQSCFRAGAVRRAFHIQEYWHHESWRPGTQMRLRSRRGTSDVGLFKLAFASPIFCSGCGIGREFVGCKLGSEDDLCPLSTLNPLRASFRAWLLG